MSTITHVPQTEQRAIFDTPLSVQRYVWVQTFLRRFEDLNSITDVGCGNGRFLFWLKNVATLEKINFVDIDCNLIEYSLDHNLHPNLMEMLFGRQNSAKPLEVNVFCADVTLPDDRLRADVFSLVEVIEHLKPKQVELACRTVFGYYKPRVVLVTTPNREFNHLLSRDGSNKEAFRHYDHKFEWTRTQFMQWAQNVCKQYQMYTVEFDGVGTLEGKSEAFGPCTQIAIFARQVDYTETVEDVADLVCCDYLFDKLQMNEENNSDHSQPLVDCKLMTTFTIPGKAACHSPNYTSQTYEWSMEEDSTTSSGDIAADSP